MSETFTRTYVIAWTVRNPYAHSAEWESFDDLDAALACVRERLWTGKPYETVQIAREEKDVTQFDVTQEPEGGYPDGRVA